MSNLWRHDQASAAASVGSFAIWSKPAPFRPWGGNAAPDEQHSEGEAPTDATVAADIDAFTEGFEAGRRTAEEALAAERQAITRLAKALECLSPEPAEPLAALLAETVDRLVRQIVGEVEIDQALLMHRAEAVARLVGEELSPSKMRVNPADVALLAGAGLPVEVTGDASLMRGEVVLETASGWIEDGPAVRLERLRAELERLGIAGE